uniref:Uncharacterized protein n=1 Tax=Candidatus Kentrum sp. LPFa TaxID=2126335 RepID=A0A450XTC5_9GAMM|nr:MAG: hypothetical protein BECKLPF1236A_GA0070988_101664 [Candidatus Kentron sp. LPFa]VFK32498.1 MAG: hypothetical protein BECKLPF1236C_GA0070990_101694 [Candidatus Kentron sp. LPFa]
MKQDQLNRITELVCGIANGYVQLIPGSYPIIRYACNVLQFVWTLDADVEQLTQEKQVQPAEEGASKPEPTRSTDSLPPPAPQQPAPQPKLAPPSEPAPAPQPKLPPQSPSKPQPLAFVKGVLPGELPDEHRCWTGNDTNKRGYTGRIPAGENPVYLELHWRKDKKASPKLVGGFILDVAALEKEGYLAASSDGDICIRLMHESDGRVYVGRSVDKRIPIGEVST